MLSEELMAVLVFSCSALQELGHRTLNSRTNAKNAWCHVYRKRAGESGLAGEEGGEELSSIT